MSAVNMFKVLVYENYFVKTRRVKDFTQLNQRCLVTC